MPISSNQLLFVSAITSRIPRIRGIGLLLAIIREFYIKRQCEMVEKDVLGSRMRLNPNNTIDNMLLFTPQYYDPEEFRIIRSIVSTGDYVIDVGGNVGAYALLFGRLVGSTGKVTTIEANPAMAVILTENIAMNKMNWVQVRNAGASDKIEQLELSINVTGNPGASTFLETGGESRKQLVNCAPLVELIDQSRRPTLIKLDIEGFEYRVLKNYFENIPVELRPPYLMVEDTEAHRENDTMSLMNVFGYKATRRIGHNVFLTQEISKNSKI